jgi:hypothetical protein
MSFGFNIYLCGELSMNFTVKFFFLYFILSSFSFKLFDSIQNQYLF